MKHEVFEKNSLILLIGILIVVSIGGIVQIAPLVLGRQHDREGEGHAPLLAARAGRPRHLRARGLLRLPQPDDPHAARRGRALRPLQPRRREHVRPPVPVGLQAHRAGSGPRRRQVLRPMARRASDQSARAGAGKHHAGLSVAGRDQARCARHRRASCKTLQARRRALHRRDDRQGAGRISSRRSSPDSRPAREMLRRYPKAKVAQVRRQARHASRASSTRWSPTCRCWARSSTSPPSTPPARTCAEERDS